MRETGIVWNPVWDVRIGSRFLIADRFFFTLLLPRDMIPWNRNDMERQDENKGFLF